MINSLPSSRSGVRVAIWLLVAFLTSSAHSEDSLQPAFCRPGPWGSLEYYEVFLEAPEKLISLSPSPARQTIWRFPGKTANQLKEFFQSIIPNPEMLDELLQPSQWFVTSSEVHIQPGFTVIDSLLPEDRAAIYEELAKSRKNPLHRNPAVVDSESVEAWLKGARVSQDIVKLISKLSYSRGKQTVFSDTPFVLSQLPSTADEQRFLKAITRTRSLVVRILLDEKTNLHEVANYWSSGKNFKESLPFLESVARSRGIDHLDITHFFPPVPRKHIYTFPALESGQSGRYPDSFWLMFNFFEFWPDETPSESIEIESRLLTNYTKVERPEKYGDAIIVRDVVSQQILQGSIYLADDIIYTKNGAGIYRPWILTKIKRLQDQWFDRETQLETWRLKSFPTIKGVL